MVGGLCTRIFIQQWPTYNLNMHSFGLQNSNYRLTETYNEFFFTNMLHKIAIRLNFSILS